MQHSPFTRSFLLMFSGPLIWAAHFLAVYALVALACARHFAEVEWLGVGVVLWGIGACTLAALGAIGAITRNMHAGKRDADAGFVYWTTATTGGLSALAIVWETIPALIVPPCG